MSSHSSVSSRPDDPSSAQVEHPSAVHIQFLPTEGHRLRRSEPTTCGNGTPLWTERPLLMKRADGTYELIGMSRNLPGLARWVLSFGSDAKVQGPDCLRRRVVVEARQLLGKYTDRESCNHIH